MHPIDITISNCPKKERLDIALTGQLSEMSRRKIRRIIDTGGCYLNKKRVRVASRLVSDGDKIKLYPENSKKTTISPMTKKDIVFKNDDYMVVCKPRFLPSQETRSDSKVHLSSWVADFFPELKSKLKLVHRLDIETSGLMILALNTKTQKYFFELFKSRDIQKEYEALCFGTVFWKSKSVIDYLSKISQSTGKVKIMTSDDGLLAKTYFEILKQKDGYVHMNCQPTTGRSHQLRIQLENQGLPIVGDKKYGDSAVKGKAGSLYLHAKKLTFIDNKKVERTFKIDVPSYWELSKIFT